MRTLCLLLILANILFLAWSKLIDVRVNALDRAAPRTATQPERIVLAQEAQDTVDDEDDPIPDTIKEVQPPAVEPLGSTERAALGTSADTLTCTTIGPFPDLSQAAQAQAALREAGFEPRQRMEQGELWLGYWVSVQGLPTRDAAERALKTLSSSGITDVYLMPGSEPPNVLSLGVFTDYQRAQRRVDDVRALGLAPRIDDRKRAGSVYWIDVDLQQPGQIIDSSIFRSDPGKITRLEMRMCPEAANG
jgi:SPOR domain